MTSKTMTAILTNAAIGAAVFLGAAVSLPASAEAASQRINCPLPEARREITTAVPSGWWNTPIVNRLTEVRVQTIGGKPALVCKYGAAGTVQRYAPAGATCRANGRHFVCQTRTASGPGTFSTGGLDVRQTYTFDLDRGRQGTPGDDLWFQAETRDLLYLVPRSGARLGVGNRRNRGQSGCARARYSSDRVSLRDIPVGSYICVKTNEGRISQFRVNALSRGNPKTLRIGYTTWN
ncbi:MAG: hypothetical protein AAGB15_05000 [Pseudomonadota bacterium]